RSSAVKPGRDRRAPGAPPNPLNCMSLKAPARTWPWVPLTATEPKSRKVGRTEVGRGAPAGGRLSNKILFSEPAAGLPTLHSGPHAARIKGDPEYNGGPAAVVA